MELRDRENIRENCRAGIESNTAEEAIDSKCDIGSPMCLTAFLKYKSWLKTFSDCIVKEERKKNRVMQKLPIWQYENKSF